MDVVGDGTPDIRVERADFDGILISILSYGALVMLYIQLLRVLLTRPKRGKVFWGITIYSGLLFTMASIAAGGKIKYAEYVYIASQFDPIVKSEGLLPSEIFKEHASKMVNVMSRVSTTLTPWIGDAFMIYRVMVVWNYRLWLLLPLLPIYFAHVGMSIPLLIADTRMNEARWEPRSQLYGIIFHTLCVALNTLFSLMITARLVTMRSKLQIALGKLQASFYTSGFTILVESGSFATLWGIVYLGTRAGKHWSQNAFLQPYYYVIAITRMLIVLKMAQNQAWSKDIVSAANVGVMDWQVSSTHSVQLENAPEKNNLQPIKSPGSSTASTHTLG